MKIFFETPAIIGALCEKEGEIPPGIARRMKRMGSKVAFLPFVVERRYLKNTIACMKLIDVHALLVCGRHRREITRHLSNLDSAAKKNGSVDCLVRRGRRFVGISLAESTKSQKIVTKKRGTGSAYSKTTGKQKVTGKNETGLFCQSVVEVLTQGLK